MHNCNSDATTTSTTIPLESHPKRRRSSTISLDVPAEDVLEMDNLSVTSSSSSSFTMLLSERHVHFAESVMISSTPSPLDQIRNIGSDDLPASSAAAFADANTNTTTTGMPLLNPMYTEIWYQPSDMILFRTEVRELCRKIRHEDEQGPNYNPRLLCLSRKEQTRGLEQRSCLERQRRKYLASKIILKASQKTQDVQQLARLAKRITSWASELAIREAQRDYRRVYGTHQHLEDGTTTTIEQSPQLVSPMKSNSKRRLIEHLRILPERCVRSKQNSILVTELQDS